MKFKKLTALLLAGIMTLSLAACGSDGEGSSTTSTDNSSSQEQASDSVAGEETAEGETAGDLSGK